MLPFFLAPSHQFSPGQIKFVAQLSRCFFSSIKVTIYAVKTPSGNSTDLNEKLSQAKEYLTRDDILKVLVDEDGNLSPNLTNDKELEVRKGKECLSDDFHKKREPKESNMHAGLQQLIKMIWPIATNAKIRNKPVRTRSLNMQPAPSSGKRPIDGQSRESIYRKLPLKRPFAKPLRLKAHLSANERIIPVISPPLIQIFHINLVTCSYTTLRLKYKLEMTSFASRTQINTFN